MWVTTRKAGILAFNHRHFTINSVWKDILLDHHSVLSVTTTPALREGRLMHLTGRCRRRV